MPSEAGELSSERSRIRLPQSGSWQAVCDFFCAHFARVDSQIWRHRFEQGLIQDPSGVALTLLSKFVDYAGQVLSYRREVINERPIPFTEQILFESEQILVADKPHFLPVTPVGAYVEQTLLRRLQRHSKNSDLIPAHRIDQGTAGLVLLVKQKAHRAAYQALFRTHQIEKTYHAVAPFCPELVFPMRRCTRLVDAEHFMQMQEVEGPANCETDIVMLERLADGHALYQLQPKTGKRHQLRTQMSALGIPILNDPIYPVLKTAEEALDFAKPLKLLAQRLRFVDPVTGISHDFSSSFSLD